MAILVAFSEDVRRRAGLSVTVIRHSYGGSIVGTERMGLTADRVIYVEAAGASVGCTARGLAQPSGCTAVQHDCTGRSPIGAVQGIPFEPHGADFPTDARRHHTTGRPRRHRMADGRSSTHSDVLAEPSDAWRAITAVITGDRDHIR